MPGRVTSAETTSMDFTVPLALSSPCFKAKRSLWQFPLSLAFPLSLTFSLSGPLGWLVLLSSSQACQCQSLTESSQSQLPRSLFLSLSLMLQSLPLCMAGPIWQVEITEILAPRWAKKTSECRLPYSDQLSWTLKMTQSAYISLYFWNYLQFEFHENIWKRARDIKMVCLLLCSWCFFVLSRINREGGKRGERKGASLAKRDLGFCPVGMAAFIFLCLHHYSPRFPEVWLSFTYWSYIWQHVLFICWAW